MTSKHPDAWLWIGITVLGCYAAMTVHKQLANIREASKVTQDDQPPDMLSAQTENALKLETLDQLTQGANQDIRAASVRILTERALQDGVTWRLMLRDISGPDIERRDKALTCVRFILPSSRDDEKTDAIVCSLQTFTAIIDCLCNLIPEACEAERGSDSGSLYHTQPERDALHILEYIFPCNIDKAIKAGLISKWLANYPFGGPDASPSRKHEIMIDISNRHLSYEDDEFGRSMNTILGHVFKDAVLRHQMIKDVLTDGPLANDSNGRGPRWDRNSETEAWNRIPEGAIRISSGWSTGTREILDDRMDFSDWFRQVPEGAVRTSEGYSLGGGQRRREESIEERALRRRRREAVVVGRNGQPIQSEDIIQREAAVLHEVVEEESEFDTADTFDWLVRPDGVDPVSS